MQGTHKAGTTNDTSCLFSLSNFLAFNMPKVNKWIRYQGSTDDVEHSLERLHDILRKVTILDDSIQDQLEDRNWGGRNWLNNNLLIKIPAYFNTTIYCIILSQFTKNRGEIKVKNTSGILRVKNTPSALRLWKIPPVPEMYHSYLGPILCRYQFEITRE